VLIVAAVLTGGLLFLLREPPNASRAALSPLPTLIPVCLPLLGGDLALAEAGFVTNANGSATFSLRLQHQGADDLTRISFATAGWTLLAPAHGATVSGLLGDHQVSWNSAAGRMEFTPLFGGYNLGAVEHFSFTVQGFVPAQPMQLTVRKGENVLETHTIDLSNPACNRTPAPFSPLPTPTPTPVGGLILPTESQVARCVFEPPPGGAPAEPIIPLSAYSFSEPQVVLTHTAPIAIQQWLPDSKTLMIVREASVSQTVSVDLVNITTGVITQVVESRPYLMQPRWLDRNHTVFWREVGELSNSVPGYWEPGYQLRSLEPLSELRLSSSGNGPNVSHDVSPDGNKVVFMSLPGGTQPFIWNQEYKTLRSLPVDLAAWRYEKENFFYPFQPFNVNWHPSGNRVLFWDGVWVFLYDLTTNSGCEIDMYTLSPLYPSIREASWSPNGRYLLMKIALDPPYTSIRGPYGLLLILDSYTGETVQHSLDRPVSNFSWSSDNQTIAMKGLTGQRIGKFPSFGFYLLNVHSGEYRRILPEHETLGAMGEWLEWSPDGRSLVLQCMDAARGELGGIFDRICISHVSPVQ
jgi:hypothetical protein